MVNKHKKMVLKLVKRKRQLKPRDTARYTLSRKRIMNSDEDKRTLLHADNGSKLAKPLWKMLANTSFNTKHTHT